MLCWIGLGWVGLSCVELCWVDFVAHSYQLWSTFQRVSEQQDAQKDNTSLCVVLRRHKTLSNVVMGPPLRTILSIPMELCPSTGFAEARWLSLLFLAALSVPSLPKSLPAAYGDNEGTQEGTGLIQCGEYSNQVLPNGRCKIVATLPQGDEQRCPDMFRCTDEVSYWLHENEERKQQILELRELISELQEELRNHRHRIKVLELQVKLSLVGSLCVVLLVAGRGRWEAHSVVVTTYWDIH